MARPVRVTANSQDNVTPRPVWARAGPESSDESHTHPSGHQSGQPREERTKDTQCPQPMPASVAPRMPPQACVGLEKGHPVLCLRAPGCCWPEQREHGGLYRWVLVDRLETLPLSGVPVPLIPPTSSVRPQPPVSQGTWPDPIPVTMAGAEHSFQAPVSSAFPGSGLGLPG